MIWFTSDTHFDHRNIIPYSRRPFMDLEEMNAELVRRWNERVAPTDVVYHLGDFCMGTRGYGRWRPLLNGRIHFVLGNHDTEKEARKWFDSVQDVRYLRHEGMRFYLSHYGHRVWRNSHHGAFHLYGHSHGDLPGIGRSMDVGVDACGFAPISLDEVVQRLSAYGPTDHHQGQTTKESAR